MANPTLEKAKQQASDLKAGMSFEHWLKKWGFTNRDGAFAKISRPKKSGLLPSAFTTGLKKKPKLIRKPMKPLDTKSLLE